MRVIHLNHSDIVGGAARAAYRIHHCLRDAGTDSRMWVKHAKSGDWTVEAPSSRLEKLTAHIRERVARQLRRTLKTANPIIHSPAVSPSQWAQRINQSDADVVHLHWAAGEMISVADIGRIQKPMVWTLHDMWAFCGAEHYTEDDRWRKGYRADNRPAYESGFDLNRWTWERKRKNWTRPIHVVAPSRWMAECVRSSALMADWPVHLIPNAIDTGRWRPIDQHLARDLLGLPRDVPLLLFGAMGGGRDLRKGYDLLLEVLTHLRGELPGLQLLVFGQSEPKDTPDIGFPVHYTGHLQDALSLRTLYSAANALVVPSRQDNLPNTAVEAHACGTPVVAFDIGGQPDIVEHERTGFLAKPFDTAELAKGLRWTLTDADPNLISRRARDKATRDFAYPVVAAQYRQTYDVVIRGH
jgi:glycosyltransferase involved in cell wall biosynthesis